MIDDVSISPDVLTIMNTMGRMINHLKKRAIFRLMDFFWATPVVWLRVWGLCFLGLLLAALDMGSLDRLTLDRGS